MSNSGRYSNIKFAIAISFVAAVFIIATNTILYTQVGEIIDYTINTLCVLAANGVCLLWIFTKERRQAMNRAQKRKQERSQRNKSHADRMKGFEGFPRKFSKPANVPMLEKPMEAEEPDFSEVPLATICQSIQLLIDELRSRGYPMYDYDNKEKSIQLIQILQGKVFFMAAEEEKEHGEV